MSGGGGGGGQMPMASNRGQQMQNPQMGQQMGVGQGGMFGQGGTSMMTNPNMGGQIAPMQVGQQVGGGFMGPRDNPALGLGPTQEQAQHFQDMMPYMQKDANGNLTPGGPARGPYGGPPAMGGGMGSTPSFANQQAYDDFMAQGGMQGIQDRMSGIGGLLGGQMPQQGMTKKQIFEMYGAGGGPSFPAPIPYAYDEPRNPGYGMIDVDRGFPGGQPLVQNPGPGRSYPINDGPMMPPRGGYPAPTNTTMPLPPRMGADGVGDGTGPGGMGFGPRLGFNDFRKGDLPGKGMPPGYGPTKGPIDGRKLRDMMDIRTRRPMDGLPNALENNLPPSLKRPTQNRRG